MGSDVKRLRTSRSFSENPIWYSSFLSAMLRVPLALMVMALFSLAAGEEKETGIKPPLNLELIPAQVTLDRNQPAEVFLLLQNSGQTALRAVELTLYIPSELGNIATAWKDLLAIVSGKSTYTLPNLEPLEHIRLELKLRSLGAWTSVRAAMVIIGVAYKWEPKGVGKEISA